MIKHLFILYFYLCFNYNLVSAEDILFSLLFTTTYNSHFISILSVYLKLLFMQTFLACILACLKVYISPMQMNFKNSQRNSLDNLNRHVKNNILQYSLCVICNHSKTINVLITLIHPIKTARDDYLLR